MIAFHRKTNMYWILKHMLCLAILGEEQSQQTMDNVVKVCHSTFMFSSCTIIHVYLLCYIVKIVTLYVQQICCYKRLGCEYGVASPHAILA